MSNDHGILFITWILSADGEVGEDRRQGVRSSHESNGRSVRYNNPQLSQISNPRQRELKGITPLWLNRVISCINNFLKHEGAHRHFFPPKLGLIKKNHWPWEQERIWEGDQWAVRGTGLTSVTGTLLRGGKKDARHRMKFPTAPMRMSHCFNNEVENSIHLTEIHME